MTKMTNVYRHEIESWQNYWLRVLPGEWREVTFEEYSEAERKAGFFATAGFGANGVQGRVTSSDQNIAKLYENEPDFVKRALAPTLPPHYNLNIY